ncbi:uncharacterized protein CcaverHIS019_0502290 [Cutaneotrichosporon cavernicola]|uniref:Origin recognition complex subunit 5 C-terminal domain-containing protein n=1 Tax=Cutaneotrichosporon cavernicola TaxID=279322 RepID=A0AA48L5W7_9TREE|nr:uncharacterized protein CcaverHIS019_0502290 [Cutaneotrichosporon cavernicola]BEI92601.1 hypothetical protein CcaverHIS019_0502290 [Cutaneotrichosporon cavernicola]
MTRLGELVGLPATLVLCSQMPWDDLRPARADAPEPIHVYLDPPSRQDTLSLLLPGSQHPLYPRFLDLLLSSMGNLASPSDLEYVASALWPLYTATLPPHEEMTLIAMFSSLYAEHAPRPPELEIAFGYDAYQSLAESERRRDEEMELDERWEDEVDHLAHSTRLWSLIPELEGQGLLRRTSPSDRLDNVTLRCEIDYDTARDIARDLRFTLDDYLYELNV